MPASEKLKKEIELRFAHHPPQDSQVAGLHGELRIRCQALAEWMADEIPESRELSRALTALEDVMYNGNAAIARRITAADSEPAFRE